MSYFLLNVYKKEIKNSISVYLYIKIYVESII